MGPQIRLWLKRMFTSFVIHMAAYSVQDEYAMNYRFELLFDMDVYL